MTNNNAPIPLVRAQRRDSQLKIKAILKAATKLFLRDGFAATSMDAIALAANVSKRTVYGHFGNKKDLFAAIIRDLCSDVLPPFTALPDNSEDVEDRLTRIGVAFLTRVYAQEQIRLFRTVVTESRIYPEIGEMMFEGPISRSNHVIADYLREMQARRKIELDDADLAAVQFLGMLKTDIHIRLLFNQKLKLDQADIENIARRSARLFLYGAQPKKAGNAKAA